MEYLSEKKHLIYFYVSFDYYFGKLGNFFVRQVITLEVAYVTA